ncbi:variant 2, Protein root UVB sensitive 3 [Lathyrus oleraceus]|nr:variant 2, Protein root UVB sensitive 3 [Pisum sativum]
MLMDLISPLFPSAFVFIVCLGSISRSFTGVASGATRAALTQHFALQDNAADISAKEGSQDTVATMVGMALGMLVARITIGHPLAIWFSFLSLTMFHMYANYRAVRCLALNSLNPERSSILLHHFTETGQVLSPKQVSSLEHVLPIQLTPWHSKKANSLDTKVRLGTRISSFDEMEIKEHLLSVASYYTKAKYLLVEKKGIVNVIVHKDSNGADILKSFIHALVLANNAYKSKSLHSDSQTWMENQYEVFIQKSLSKLSLFGTGQVIRVENRTAPIVTYHMESKLDTPISDRKKRLGEEEANGRTRWTELFMIVQHVYGFIEVLSK